MCMHLAQNLCTTLLQQSRISEVSVASDLHVKDQSDGIEITYVSQDLKIQIMNPLRQSVTRY